MVTILSIFLFIFDINHQNPTLQNTVQCIKTIVSYRSLSLFNIFYFYCFITAYHLPFVPYLVHVTSFLAHITPSPFAICLATSDENICYSPNAFQPQMHPGTLKCIWVSIERDAFGTSNDLTPQMHFITKCIWMH